MAKPFLKWVGGKRKLIPFLMELIPDNIETYYEPFVGGGAFFYALEENKLFKNAVINDFNKELINAYSVIKSNLSQLIYNLQLLKDSYHSGNKEEFYYIVRNNYYLVKNNFTGIQASVGNSATERAARFIFLNKCCFNGMYRVNKKGKFNVPFGKHANPPILQSDVLIECEKALTNTIVLNGDFEPAIANAKSGDLIMCDPPYVPISKTSNFTSYTESGFNIAEQERLSKCMKSLANNGVSVIISNSNTEIVRDLYSGLNIHEVQMARNINSDATKRSKITELVITNLSP